MKALFISLFVFIFGIVNSLILAADAIEKDGGKKDAIAKEDVKKDSVRKSIEDRDAISLSLREVFSQIECENLTVLLNRQKIEEALQEANIKKADLYPQIDLSITQVRQKDFVTVPIFFTFQTNRYDGLINGSVPVVDFRKMADYKSAKMGYRISILNYEAIVQDILNQVGSNYFLHIRNLKSLDVSDVNIHRSEVLLDLAKTRFNAGAASAIDVTRAEIQLASDKRERLQKETLVKQSELNLKYLLDLDMRVPIKVDESDWDGKAESPSAYEFSVCTALDIRPDYRSASAQLIQSEYDRRAARWDYYPKVRAFGDWGWGSKTPFDGNDVNEWEIGINLSMPIFDGYRISSNIKKQTAIVREKSAALEDLGNSIASELWLNKQNLESLYQQIDLVKKQVELSEKELELASDRFKHGVADNTDVVTAQANLAQFNDALVNIVYGYNLARLEWARAMGEVRAVLDKPADDLFNLTTKIGTQVGNVCVPPAYVR